MVEGSRPDLGAIVFELPALLVRNKIRTSRAAVSAREGR